MACRNHFGIVAGVLVVLLAGCGGGSTAAVQTVTAPASTSLVPSPPAADAAAKELARVARTAAEVSAVDNNGSYAKVRSPKSLAAVEPTIATSPTNGGSYLSAARGTSTGYSVTVTSATGDTFTIRSANGVTTLSCAGTIGKACVNGSW